MAVKANKTMQNVLIVGAVVLGIYIIGSQGDGTKPSVPVTEKAPLATTPGELLAAYSANEAAAQDRFGSTPLKLTGVVESVTLDISNNPVVHLADAPGAGYATLNLTEGSAVKAKALVKGQKLSPRCESVSEVLGNPILAECAF